MLVAFGITELINGLFHTYSLRLYIKLESIFLGYSSILILQVSYDKLFNREYITINVYLQSFDQIQCFMTSIAFAGISISISILVIIGIALSTRHFRAGKELPMLAENKHYDFNYQVGLF